MNILDVACGETPFKQATVCGDLYTQLTFHRDGVQPLEAKKYPNFIKFDALHLPFKNNSFDLITAFAILEHVQEPLKALQEWSRVAPKLIMLVPERNDEFLACNPMHLYSWSAPTLEHLLRLVYQNVQVTVSKRSIGWFRKGWMPAMINFTLRSFLSKLWLFRREELIAIATL